MQPDDSKKSCTAMASLAKDQDCDFDTTLKGARLRPIQFQSRQCLEREQHNHSLIGEAATGQWVIGICQKYLVGQHFFWLCDCSAMKEILEYTGNIHQVRRWSQELLGYHFTILHRPARMMQDVDALSRFYDPLIDSYNTTASQFRLDDCTQCPHAYCKSLFPTFALNVQKYNLKEEPAISSPHILNPCPPNLLISTPWNRSSGYQGYKPLTTTSANHENFHRSLVAAHITRQHRHWLSYDSFTGCLATKLHHSFSPFGQLCITHIASTKETASVSERLILRSDESHVICCPSTTSRFFYNNNTSNTLTTLPTTHTHTIPQPHPLYHHVFLSY